MDIYKFVGFLLPPAIDLINRKIADSDLRFWVSIAFCAVIGLGISWMTGVIGNVNEVINTIFVVFGTAQITYKTVYDASKLQTSIRSGESGAK